MSDFITELEEDIREEKLFALWHKYGHFLVGIALVIILSTVGYTLWTYFEKKSRLENYASLSKGIELIHKGETEKAREIFQALGKTKGGYAQLAQLYEASLLPNPVALYEKMAKENPTNLAFSNLCKLFMASHSSQDPLLVLEPLSAPKSAWAPLALELMGFFESQKGETEEAIGYYRKALQEPYLTPAERTRIGMTIAQMNVPLSLSPKGH